MPHSRWRGFQRAVCTVMACYEEGQLQRLLLVQPRIAEGGVVQAQIVVDKPFASPRAFCDGIARELQMHATQERAVLFVNPERRRQLGEDAAEGSRLDACRRAPGVSVERLACMSSAGPDDLPVHGIALPDNNVATGFHDFNVLPKQGLDLVSPVPRD